MLVIETFDLADGQIEETHTVTYFDGAFRTGASHGGTEATIELEDGEFIEDRGDGDGGFG